MDVALELSIFITNDEGHFSVGFEAFDTVKNLGSSAPKLFGAV
jgi:hypothetical protein